MEKEKLHRFFAGTTSIQEGMDIRAWMEASEENKRIFYKERKLFDALMVHDDQTTNNCIYNPQIQISAESETKRSIFREKDKTKRSKKESAQHSKSRNKSFVMTSVSAL